MTTISPKLGQVDPLTASRLSTRDLDAAKGAAAGGKDVEKAASGFEALLLHQMIEGMWKTVDFAGMFNEDGNEASIYRDMFSQAVADSIATGRGIGVKEVLKKQLAQPESASKSRGRA